MGNTRKIGLLSVYNHNYGSILQAYAMQRILMDMGLDVEIIRYKKTNMFKQALRLFNIPLLKATIRMKYKDMYCKLCKKEIHQKILKTRELAFSEFVSTHIRFSKIYAGRMALKNGCNKYDTFVLGSDQVWNPMNLGSDFFTMTFIPDDKPKITYASSFGVSVIPIYQKNKTKAYLKRINYISVREISGQKIVKELTGRDIPVVVDPTILLSRDVWDAEKGEPIVKEKYIMCYFISSNPLHRDFARRLAYKTGCKIVSVPHVDEYVKEDVGFGDIVPKGVGPLQFVNLISNADYVCTDSFHGTVFSILYNKTFFTFNRYSGNGKDSTNSRLHSILKLIGLESRMFDSEMEIYEELLTTINYEKSHKQLERLRTESINYLNNAIYGQR